MTPRTGYRWFVNLDSTLPSLRQLTNLVISGLTCCVYISLRFELCIKAGRKDYSLILLCSACIMELGAGLKALLINGHSEILIVIPFKHVDETLRILKIVSQLSVIDLFTASACI